MRLGNFSVSLAVKDLAASRAFYEKLGFRVVAGDQKGYVILQNETSTIGLFQGMLEKNTLTFNPGETSKTITIEVKGDDNKEANETFYLDLLGNSNNSLFTKNRGIGTILNDD